MTSDEDVLVRVEGVSKKFCRSLKRSLWYGLCDVVSELNPFGSSRNRTRHNHDTSKAVHEKNPPGRNGITNYSDLECNAHTSLPNLSLPNNGSELRPDEFWAVDNVSFELRRGECLGLIGHNGAGKTTLLKMLTGLIKPDKGRIEIRGRVGALIALGAGFNPILTGRENIYVNASVLGLSKREIDQKFDAIVDFAAIREFIDAPVQSYSSGMQVRLGFAVATAMEPDVLIVDEVLAVGDDNYKEKSLLRVNSLLKKCAVIFVSHSESQVRRIATTGILISAGTTQCAGAIDDCYQAYHLQPQSQSIVKTPPPVYDIQIENVQPGQSEIQYQHEWVLELDASSRYHKDIDLFVFGFRANGEFWAQAWQKVDIHLEPKSQRFRVNFGFISLAEGQYDLTLSIFSNGGRLFQYHNNKLATLVVNGRQCFQIKAQINVAIHRCEANPRSTSETIAIF